MGLEVGNFVLPVSDKLFELVARKGFADVVSVSVAGHRCERIFRPVDIVTDDVNLFFGRERAVQVLNFTRQAYYFYETDKATPPAQKIVELSTTYDMSADYLLGLSNVPVNPTVTDVDNKLIEAVIACHNALQAVIKKRGLKNGSVQNNESDERQDLNRSDTTTD